MILEEAGGEIDARRWTKRRSGSGRVSERAARMPEVSGVGNPTAEMVLNGAARMGSGGVERSSSAEDQRMSFSWSSDPTLEMEAGSEKRPRRRSDDGVFLWRKTDEGSDSISGVAGLTRTERFGERFRPPALSQSAVERD